MAKALFAPSLLSADFLDLGKELARARAAGADRIHYDVMDGNFVPPISFGAKILADIAPGAGLPLDVHLMTLAPWDRFEDFARAGASSITFHIEACPDPLPSLRALRALGLRAGLSLNPATPASSIEAYLGLVDIVLVMTVNPGYGGQKMMPEGLAKLAELARMRKARGLAFELQVDGGVNAETVPEALRAGADLLVAGNAFFGPGDPGALLRAIRGE